MLRIVKLVLLGAVCVAASAAVVLLTTAGGHGNAGADALSNTLLSRTASQSADASQSMRTSQSTRTSQDAPQFEVHVRQPEGPPSIAFSTADPQGRTGKAACSTCHSVRPANFANKTPATLDEFHQGLKFNHGGLACYSCHHPENLDSLRLADGESVAYPDVMTLCSQCHSAQATSFAHGAHGGMNGYWDLSRGPQLKNNCIDCHDPHAPSYPKMIVGFKPRDRFLQEGEPPHDKHE